LQTIYPAYADRLGFVAVGVDPAEGADLLRKTAASRGYSWPIAKGSPEMLKTFGVLTTSTKFAVDRSGIITYQAGYGVGDATTWRKVFEGLTKA